MPGGRKGRFRTRGRYSSATVRGTYWPVADRCDGTFTQVRRGVVDVFDFRPNRVLRVRQGRTHLSRSGFAASPARRPAYDRAVRPRPNRLERLPEQYFATLLGRVAAAAADGGPPRRRPRARQPRGRAAAARRRGAARGGRAGPDVHGYAPFRGPAAAARGDRRPLPRPSTASSSTRSARSRSCPGRRRRSSSSRLALAERGDTILLPDPYYPDYPSGVALAGRRRSACCRSTRRPAGARPRRGAARRGRVPQLPVEPVRRLRAARARSRRRSPTPQRTGTAIVARRRLHRPRLRRPRAARASSRRRARRTSASRCGRCRRPTAWPAGGSASSSATPRSSSGSTCSATTRASASSRRSRRRRSPRSTGPQDSVEERRATYERRRDRLVAALPEPPVCEGTFYVWLRLPEGLTADRLLAEQRVAVAPGRGLRAERRRLGAALARRHRRDARARASSGSRPRSRRRTREDRDRRPVLVVVLGRRRRARREPGRRAARPRPRGEDPDGATTRPGLLTRLLHPRTGRHGDLPAGIIPVGRSVVVPANGSLPNIVLSPRSDRPRSATCCARSASTSSTCTSR